MPAFLNWILRLLPTNPICMRLVQGGSRRMRHLYLRSGYLAVMIIILLFAMVANVKSTPSVRELAAGAANTFMVISYLQVGLICLLTPIFMAGAISQEANPKTWDILLTTPLNSLQIVLGNLFGRLFFVLALLFSTLPLFAVTQYFGGVPGESIFASYAIAGASCLLVGAVAVTLSVNRTAGRRAVFWFYISVVMYIFITYAMDKLFRMPVGPGTSHTTLVTSINPFLALDVLLKSNAYVPWDSLDPVLPNYASFWLFKIALSQPIKMFCWSCVGLSTFLIAFSTIRVRIVGAKVGVIPWYRKLLGIGAKGSIERPARHVGQNPVAWRESVARGKTAVAILTRWGFVAVGIALGLTLVILYHVGTFTATELQLAIMAVLCAEIVIIALIALNMSATAVTQEREDGTLDLILTTPIQPGPYITGKMRGLVQYLVPMMLVPIGTVAILSIYVLFNGFGNAAGVTMMNVRVGSSTQTINSPLILPEGVLLLPLVLVPFVAACVMIGLQWSIKSKGTIGSVIGAVGVVVVMSGLLGLCATVAGSGFPVIGAVITGISPVNLIYALIYPADAISDSLQKGMASFTSARISLAVGALIATVVYCAIVYAIHSMIKRTFMMTVRKLAGTN